MPDVVGTGVIRVEVDDSGVEADLAKAVDKSNTSLQTKSKSSGDAAGKSWGDAYSKALQSKIGTAIKALPGAQDIKLGVSTDDATTRILLVKAELNSLSEQKIGIDISDADAMAKIAAIKAELTLLSKSDNTQIKVDASQALTALGEIDDALDTTKKKAADAGGGNGMGLLLKSAIALGPALIPLGAVGAAALGAFGLAAGSVALGVKGIATEMKNGTAEGQIYTSGVKTLEGELSTLEGTAATGLLKPFNAAVKDASGLFPELNKEVGQFATLGGEIAEHTLVGLIGGFTAMRPLINEIGLDLNNGALDFQKWTQDGGLQKFATYAEAELPKVISTVEQLGGAIITIVKDIAPFGGVGLTGLKLLSEVINDLPVSVARELIDVLAGGLVVFKGYQILTSVSEWYDKASKSIISYAAAQKASAAANTLQASTADKAAAADSAQAVGEGAAATEAAAETVAVSAESVANSAQATTGALSDVAQAGKGAGGALGGIGETLGAVGESGLGAAAGVAALVVAVGIGSDAFAHYLDKASAVDFNSKALKADISAYTSALEANNGVVDASTNLVAAQALQQNGLADNAAKSGISLSQLTQGVTGTDAQFKALYDTWKASGDPSNATLVALGQQRAAFLNGSSAADKYNAAVAASAPPVAVFNDNAKTTAATIAILNNEYSLSADTASKYAAIVGYSSDKLAAGKVTNLQYSNALSAVSIAEDNATETTSKYLDALSTFASSNDTASDKAALLGATLVASQGDLLSYQGAVAGGYAATQALTSAFASEAQQIKAGTLAYSDSEKAAIQFTTSGKTLSANINDQAVGAGALITQLQGMQTAAESAAQATYQHEVATKGDSAALADAQSIFESLTGGSLTANAKQLGLTTKQAQALSTAYFNVPKNLTTTVQSVGLNDIDDTLNSIGQQLGFISGHPWVSTIKATDDASPTINNIKKEINELGGTTIAFTASGKPLYNAEGNIVDYFAGGGFEDHTAQIMPRGTTRIFNEPEAGGEAYIPLNPAKRSRSTAIWQETGKRLGVQNFADGGFSAGYGLSDMGAIGGLLEAIHAMAQRPVILQADGVQIAKVTNKGNLALNRRN